MALCQMKLCLVNLYKYTYLFKIIKQDLYIHTYILVFIILWKWGLGLMWRNWNWQAVQILVDIIGIHLHANTLGKGVNSPLMRSHVQCYSMLLVSSLSCYLWTANPHWLWKVLWLISWQSKMSSDNLRFLYVWLVKKLIYSRWYQFNNESWFYLSLVISNNRLIWTENFPFSFYM